MLRGYLAFFDHRIDAFQNNAHRTGAHRLHRLPHGGQRRRAQRRSRDVIEADYRALLGHAQAMLVQGTNRSESSHIVESCECRKLPLLFNLVFPLSIYHRTESVIEVGVCVPHGFPTDSVEIVKGKDAESEEAQEHANRSSLAHYEWTLRSLNQHYDW